MIVFPSYSPPPPPCNDPSLPTSLHSFPFFSWARVRKPKSGIFTVGFEHENKNADKQENSHRLQCLFGTGSSIGVALHCEWFTHVPRWSRTFSSLFLRSTWQHLSWLVLYALAVALRPFLQSLDSPTRKVVECFLADSHTDCRCHEGRMITTDGPHHPAVLLQLASPPLPPRKGSPGSLGRALSQMGVPHWDAWLQGDGPPPRLQTRTGTHSLLLWGPISPEMGEALALDRSDNAC